MKEITESEFQIATSNGVVLIDFSAEWCGPCKAMMPVIQRVSDQYDGKLQIFTVDIDKSPELAMRHGVMSVPTFLLFKAGSVVDRVVGAVPERELRKRIDQALGAS